MKIEEMIEEFQCSGCVAGPDPKSCDTYELKEVTGGGFHCAGHVPGTNLGGPGGMLRIYLGIPKGFSRVPLLPEGMLNNITLFSEDCEDEQCYDVLNIPVWKKELDNRCTCIKVCQPRTNMMRLHLINKPMSEIEGIENALEIGDMDM